MPIKTKRVGRTQAVTLFLPPREVDFIEPPPKAEHFEDIEESKRSQAIAEALELWKKYPEREPGVRWDAKAFEAAKRIYEERKDVSLIFRLVKESTYTPWPYKLNELEMREADRLDALRATHAARKSHVCHSPGFRTEDYVNEDIALSREILSACLVGAIGFTEFEPGATDDPKIIAELIDSIMISKLAHLATRAAFKAQGLSPEESLS